MGILAANTLHRQEVRARAPGPIRVMDDGSPSSATFDVYFDGDFIANGDASIQTVAGGVIMTCAVPALNPEEGYEIRLTTSEGVFRKVIFDASLSPLGELVTLPEVLAVRHSLRRYIAQVAQIEEITPAEFVAEKAGQARSALDDMIREELRKVEGDYDRYYLFARYGPGSWLRVRAIMDVDRLHKIEVHLTVAEILRSKQDSGAEDDPVTVLMTQYIERATTAFRNLGRVRIDIDGDGQEDRTTTAIGTRAVIYRRITY